nr:cellulase family glycosylhydrolase [Mesorhizobium loti]
MLEKLQQTYTAVLRMRLIRVSAKRGNALGLVCVAMWIFSMAMTAEAAVLSLKRGIGVHDWLNWAPIEKDGSYRWPPYRSDVEWLKESRPDVNWPGGGEAEFARIRSMGFDFVRLAIDPGPMLANQGARRQQALDILSSAVERITASGLKVVFDIHSAAQVPAYSIDMVNGGADSKGVADYRQMVVEVAAMLVKFDTDKVALEPFNEPAYDPCDWRSTDDWQRIMTATVRDIRAVSTELTIVATGACGGGIGGLINLDPIFDDPNIYYSFHMYEPHSFTHQRSGKPDGAFVSGLPWPADASTPEVVIETLKSQMDVAGVSAADQQLNLSRARPRIAQYFWENSGQSQLEARFRQATDWAEEHGIPTQRLFMGEFGVILMSDDGRKGAFEADRSRYIAAVRKQAEQFGIPWATWEYSNAQGMTLIPSTGPLAPDANLLRALGLP